MDVEKLAEDPYTRKPFRAVAPYDRFPYTRAVIILYVYSSLYSEKDKAGLEFAELCARFSSWIGRSGTNCQTMGGGGGTTHKKEVLLSDQTIYWTAEALGEWSAYIQPDISNSW